MSDVDELPSWAGRAMQPGAVATSNVDLTTPDEPPQPKRRGRLAAGLLALLLAGGAGTATWWFLNQDDSSVSTDESAATTTAPPAAVDSTVGGEQVEADDTTPAAPSTTPTTETTTPATTETTTATTTGGDDDGDGPTTRDDGVITDESMVSAENPEGSLRYAILSGGKLYLRGKVPAKEVGDEITRQAGLVLGPDNVFNEYEIDPTVPVQVAGPLYVEDVILFEFNSVAIREPFLPILDLGVALMRQNPNVKITVIARTDATGDAETNLEVSQQRADAVIRYLTRKGADPARLIADPRGEEGASDDDDAQTAAMNRRAEFIISGLLG